MYQQPPLETRDRTLIRIVGLALPCAEYARTSLDKGCWERLKQRRREERQMGGVEEVHCPATADLAKL